MRVSAQRSSQRSRYACASSRLSKRSPARFDFAFAVRILHAAGQSHNAVVFQHVAVQRIERGIVDVGREHALAQIIEHHHPSRAAQSAKRLLVQLGPDPGTGSEYQQANGFPAVPQGHHEQPRAPVLAGLRVAHHGAGAVIDLAFFAGRGDDYHAGFRRGSAAQLAHETLDRSVARRKALGVHQVLIDSHRVTAFRQRGFDDLPVRFAGAGRRAPARPPSRFHGRVFAPWVGGHLYGRFCR